MHQPPLRGHLFADKRVLLIDPHQLTRDVRASVLRSHGIDVQVAESLPAAQCFWRPQLYDWILLDVRRYMPEEVLAFYAEIRDASPRAHFVFLVGPPTYLSLSWPDEFSAVASQPRQWAETVNRFLAAA